MTHGGPIPAFRPTPGKAKPETALAQAVLERALRDMAVVDDPDGVRLAAINDHDYREVYRVKDFFLSPDYRETLEFWCWLAGIDPGSFVRAGRAVRGGGRLSQCPSDVQKPF